ncbi:hypothetical protein BZK37_01610 [Enterococcus casseliflavus]|nr:hypothetical protein BZK37_01610 [Enterococcus casseliflavus]
MVPKFRAWDKENDRMIYPSTEGVYFELDDDGINILDVSGDYPEDHTFPAIDSVLMQSTGLKDKNGVEIYCGDIGWDEHLEEYGKVVFENGSFTYEWKNISEDLFEATDDIEIVGNIYENPELLEQDNE